MASKYTHAIVSRVPEIYGKLKTVRQSGVNFINVKSSVIFIEIVLM